MRKAHAISSLLRIAVFAIILFAFAPLLEASDSATVNYTTNQSITAFSTCKKVTNNSATGLNVYVPTQSGAEWQSRSEEHTSELQSQFHLLFPLLLLK